MKKLISLALAIAISLSMFILPVSAAEYQGPVDQVIVGGDDMNDNTRAANPPTTHHNLSNKDYIAVLQDLAASKGSYTKCYYTTSTKQIELTCSLQRSGTTSTLTRELEIRLYERKKDETSFNYVNSQNVTFSTDVTRTVSFTNLDNDNFYYFRFVNNSSNNPADKLDISGSIVISK